MALRGNLREFELSEIFQLISRDGKTGQLVLSHQNNEAFVIFSKGTVAGAGNSNQNLQTLLFNYLVTIKHYSGEELNELLTLCHGEMRLFSRELLNRRYILSNELAVLAQTVIEDLACDLFLWEEGTYRFDALDSIQEYIISEVTFPVDAITMEAMRRSDEWKRMKEHINSDTVFSRAPNAAPPPRPRPHSTTRPATSSLLSTARRRLAQFAKSHLSSRIEYTKFCSVSGRVQPSFRVP